MTSRPMASRAVLVGSGRQLPLQAADAVPVGARGAVQKPPAAARPRGLLAHAARRPVLALRKRNSIRPHFSSSSCVADPSGLWLATDLRLRGGGGQLRPWRHALPLLPAALEGRDGVRRVRQIRAPLPGVLIRQFRAVQSSSDWGSAVLNCSKQY